MKALSEKLSTAGIMLLWIFECFSKSLSEKDHRFVWGCLELSIPNSPGTLIDFAQMLEPLSPTYTGRIRQNRTY